MHTSAADLDGAVHDHGAVAEARPIVDDLRKAVAMPPRRLLFFPDYAADPVWDSERGGMVSLDDLPLSSGTRTDARAWARRWEQLAYADQNADAFSAGMSTRAAEAVAPEEWLSVEHDGRTLWERLRAELGDGYELGWLNEENQVEWAPGAPPEPRP